MPFKKIPYKFTIRSILDIADRNRPTLALNDSIMLVRYVPGVNDPQRKPEIEHVLLNGVDELEKRWWEIHETGSVGNARQFALVFHGHEFSEHIRTDACKTDQALYEAILDQATIVLKVNMGPVKLDPHEDHCEAPGDHVASLFLLLDSYVREIRQPPKS